MDTNTWNKEYRDINSIPSSNRAKPSEAFKLGISIIDQPVQRSLFLGCGNGRNMLGVQANQYVGVDFSDGAIEKAREIVGHQDSENIHIVKSDVEKWLDNCEDNFDLIVDSYFSCHFTKDRFRHLQDRIKSVSLENGVYFWSGIGTNDEFYTQIAEQLDGSFVRDPNNNVIKRLYTLDELDGQIIEFEKIAVNSLRFKDTVNDEEYEREVLWGLYNIN